MANCQSVRKNTSSGIRGARILQSALPGEWVYRDLEGKGDYGIDAEIEISTPKCRLAFHFVFNCGRMAAVCGTLLASTFSL